MKGRILLGGVLGGLAMFTWGFVSHALLGLTDRALKPIPAGAEAIVIATLQSSLPGPGLYIYPTLGLLDAKDEASMKRLDEALKTTPGGIITVAPPPGGMMPPQKLGFQLFGDIVAALVAAIALGMAGVAGYGRRVTLVAMFGLFAGMLINLPYWNWYGFPTAFTLPGMLDNVLRSLSAGLVLGALVKPR